MPSFVKTIFEFLSKESLVTCSFSKIWAFPLKYLSAAELTNSICFAFACATVTIAFASPSASKICACLTPWAV